QGGRAGRVPHAAGLRAAALGRHGAPMPTTLPTLNTCEREAFVAAVGPLFERSPWLAEEAFSRRPFRDARHLHAELCAGLEAADGERQLELIRAHPDLAGRLAQNAQNGELT